MNTLQGSQLWGDIASRIEYSRALRVNYREMPIEQLRNTISTYESRNVIFRVFDWLSGSRENLEYRVAKEVLQKR